MHLENLLKEYGDKWVGVCEQQLVAAYDTENKLMEWIDTRSPKDPWVYVGKLGGEKPRHIDVVDGTVSSPDNESDCNSMLFLEWARNLLEGKMTARFNEAYCRHVSKDMSSNGPAFPRPP